METKFVDGGKLIDGGFITPYESFVHLRNGGLISASDVESIHAEDSDEYYACRWIFSGRGRWAGAAALVEEQRETGMFEFDPLILIERFAPHQTERLRLLLDDVRMDEWAYMEARYARAIYALALVKSDFAPPRHIPNEAAPLIRAQVDEWCGSWRDESLRIASLKFAAVYEGFEFDRERAKDLLDAFCSTYDRIMYDQEPPTVEEWARLLNARLGSVGLVYSTTTYNQILEFLHGMGC